MLPIVLVLLVATSSLAVPIININARNLNEVAPLPDNGRIVSGSLTDRVFGLSDGGDNTPYALTAQKIINDIANLGDRSSQALAVAQVLGFLRNVANGTPGDVCASANLIDAYTTALRTGNFGPVRPALANFVQSVVSAIDLIAQLASNPDSLKFTVGGRGNCSNGGRIYNIDGAWNAILSSANPNQANLVFEQSCTAKLLYKAQSVRSNNIGAAITAVSLPPVNSIFQRALEPVAVYLRALANGNAGATAAVAKQAILRAASNVSF